MTTDGQTPPQGRLSVEEFVPRADVKGMLALTTALLDLIPGSSRTPTAHENLMRSMVWLEKYIAPTTEFWDWPPVREQVSDDVWLKLTFVGLGWVVALEAETELDSLQAVERLETNLIEILQRITSHLELDAVLRLKSTAWSRSDVEAARKNAIAHGCPIDMVHTLRRRATSPTLVLNQQEALKAAGMSRQEESHLLESLRATKQFVNLEHTFQGANWCAFKRRRLTVLRLDGKAPGINEQLFCTNSVDAGFEPTTMSDTVQVFHESQRFQAEIMFPRWGFHLGGVHPRAIITLRTSDADLIDRTSSYLSYLWISHYTRIWYYLHFEDLFAYVHDLRARKSYNEKDLDLHFSQLLDLDRLRDEIALMNRVDGSDLPSYEPHHDRVVSLRSERDPGAIYHLRTHLIPSTVTQLQSNPLGAAPDILESAKNALAASYGTYSQYAALRMQRSIQVLQLLFIIAAAAQILTVVQIGALLDSAIWVGWLSESGLGKHVRAVGLHVATTGIDMSLSCFNALVLAVLVVIALLVLRSTWGTALSRKLIGE